jgi:hypothetical protein
MEREVFDAYKGHVHQATRALEMAGKRLRTASHADIDESSIMCHVATALEHLGEANKLVPHKESHKTKRRRPQHTPKETATTETKD